LAKLPADVCFKIFEAVSELNDLEYMTKKIKEINDEHKEDEESNASWGATFILICKYFPSYTIQDILQLPAQMVIQLIDDIVELNKDAGGSGDDGYREMTAEDWEKLRKKYGAV
jgi:hypothetical protein